MSDFGDEFAGEQVPASAPQNNVDDIDDGFPSTAVPETEGASGLDMFPAVDAAPADGEAAADFGFGFADEGKGEGESAPASGAANDEDMFGLMGASAVPEEAAAGDAYTKWQKEHDTYLKNKADRLRNEKAAEAAAAKAELDEFYAKRENTIKKAKAANRSEEKQWRADLEATNSHGTQWEKVAKYCDLKPKAEGKGGQPHKTDRMRRVLVTLKSEKQ
mgnify:CR=1 FL=1